MVALSSSRGGWRVLAVTAIVLIASIGLGSMAMAAYGDWTRASARPPAIQKLILAAQTLHGMSWLTVPIG